jgi:iron complex transport system substrate-binding protein
MSTAATVGRSSISRRGLLAASGALAATALGGRALAQVSSPVASPSGSGTNGVQPDGSWRFVDDRGIEISLPKAPERVIADVNVAAALWDFGVRPVGIFGWNVGADGTLNAAAGSIDPSQVELLVEGTDILDLEKAIAIAPDLIVTLTFAPDTPEDLWSIMPEVVDQVNAIAPIVAISGIIRADAAANRFAELSAALGIDLESPEITAQKQGYDAAAERFRTLTTQKAGMSAIFVAPGETEIYIANPDVASDVMLFRDLGLNVPSVDAPAGSYWETLSFEQALKYPTDIFFYSLRGNLVTPEMVKEHPTIGQHPAVIADQIAGWNQDVVLNYAGLTTILNGIADVIEASDPHVVP